MSVSDIQWEFLKDVSCLIQYADRIGLKLTGGELYRPQLMQQYYFDNNLSKTLNSDHGNRLAIDFNFFSDQTVIDKGILIDLLALYWKDLHPNNYWGGDYKTIDDPYHFGRKK